METASRKRTLAVILAIGLALVVLAAVWTWKDWDRVGTVLVGIAVVLLVLVVGAVFVTREPGVPEGDAALSKAPPGPAPWEEAPAPVAAKKRKLTLKCKDCQTVFGLFDDGTRPLPYACPSCGKSGAIR